MYLIVGLGNPGKEYDKTRHNIGYMMIDGIANSRNIKFNQNLVESMLKIASTMKK